MKKLLSGILLATMCMMLVVPISAKEEPTVEFDGTTKLKYNMDEDAFGTNFEGMLPAEERTQIIVLKNTGNQEVAFYMSTEVIKTFEEANTDANGAGYIVSLMLMQDGKETLIYGNDEQVNVGADENGLRDMNGSLNDKFMVASIAPGKEAKVRLRVKLDGQSAGNEYQGLPGTFQFDFIVQYDDSEPETVVNTIIKDIKGETKTVIEKVMTGDPTAIGTLVLAMGMSAIAFVAFYKHKGGCKDEE